MSLKSLVKSTPGRSDAARVTIEIEGESLSFLRPRVSDLQPSRELLESVSRAVVGLRPDQVYLAYLLGTTYQPDPEEGEVVPYKLFAELAANNDLVFADLCRRWEESFPEFSNWMTSRMQAKNDSRAVSGASDIGSST